MASSRTFDDTIDERIRAHVRRKMVEHQIGLNAMARKLGIHKSTLSRVLSRDLGPNPSLVARMHQQLGESANVILDDDPDQRFFEPGLPFIPQRRRGRPPKAKPADGLTRPDTHR